MSDLQKQLFDYDALDAESRIVIQQRTGEIKTIAKRLATDIVDIGGKLAEVKDRLGGNGKFTNWLLSELGWSERTAYNFIGVYEKFGTANFAIENVAPSALYLLVAPGTPEPARHAATEMANQGERVTHKAAKVLVDVAKEAEPKTPALFDFTEDEVDEQDREIAARLDQEGVEMKAVLTPDEPELPTGWAFEEQGDGWVARNAKKGQKTLAFPAKTEAATAAHGLESAQDEGLLGMARKSSMERSVVKPQPVIETKPTAAPLGKSAWSKQQIIIGITLMPADGDLRGRQAIVSMRAGDGQPKIQPMRLIDQPGEWPWQIGGMMEAFASELATEVAKTPQKTTKKPAKKGAKK